MEEHAKKLKNIFERLEQANFKIQPEKCVFAANTEYVGHICTHLGIRLDPRKVKAIQEYPVPKYIRPFIGLVGYYRRHAPNFVKLAEPLTSLTKKDVASIWTGAHQSSVEELKRIMCTEPLLIYPNFHSNLLLRVTRRLRLSGLFYHNCMMGKKDL